MWSASKLARRSQPVLCRPTAQLLPAVDNLTEQFCRALGVVNRRMRLAFVPRNPRRVQRPRQHGLPIGQPARVTVSKLLKGWKGLRLIWARAAAAFTRLIEKGIVADQDGAGAGRFRASPGAPPGKWPLTLPLRYCEPEGMVGIDLVHRHRSGVQSGAGKGLDVMGQRASGTQIALPIHADDDGGDFQQGVGLSVDAAVSTSTMTGRKPRKRRAMRGLGASSFIGAAYRIANPNASAGQPGVLWLHPARNPPPYPRASRTALST